MRHKSHKRHHSMASRVRCAIYTRKSTEEGLEQDFNSLDAQREACEAYIQSQKQEGWRLVPAHYDDGGFSGGNLERPAFKRLLEDIESGSIDTVVVYKVDRLTRSLHDFAQIVEVFERNEVSFVSVTQQFNTTTSMGRLTLNMLLSFAQFEREVTGERIRDKIAASKRKGLWMGGLPPMGYDVEQKKLVVNLKEAEIVRLIYRRYLTHGSVHALKSSLDRDGYVSKARIDKHGRQTGGKSFARGALYKMLKNRIYRGEIVHKDRSYPGEHTAILSEDLWGQVQQTLAENRIDRGRGRRTAEPSLLVGLLYDDAGQRMTPTHTNKKGTRYRYYISQTLTTTSWKDNPRGRRVPARDIERLVEDRLTEFLANESALFDAFQSVIGDTAERMRYIDAAGDLAKRWQQLAPAVKRDRLSRLIHRIDLGAEMLSVSIYPCRLRLILQDSSEPRPLGTQSYKPPEPRVESEQTITLTVSARLKRAGMEMRLLIDGSGGGAQTKSDPSLCRLLAQAYRFQSLLLQGQGRNMKEIAAEAGVDASHFRRVFTVCFLAPDIVQAILRDRSPIELNAQQLSRNTLLPLSWDEQRSVLGFD